MNTSIVSIKRKNKAGAGRKIGTGKFGEPTKVLRIPISQDAVISDFLEAYKRKQQKDRPDSVTEIIRPLIPLKQVYLPLFSSKVPACLPPPAIYPL